ncbi:DUF4440 domain-containing protein [Algoriphagus antarcticus]|uniref:Uncharacterized protein (TIGR02246 family) n=1 Tax=Algoriphagus antarcticus TaxID=238540 RepID=A0A3E0DQI0_9BACT|nr:DUF4440 domain-containing protein [Algoriphagus antarcticus]REG84492.1 uncharacterized protein (TIGR02246 family) [Algoriphagus antarcticus]
MKLSHIPFILLIGFAQAGFAQTSDKQKVDSNEILHLINQYSAARDNRDTVLLRQILTVDVDQLVSSGEWRNGIDTAVKGMLSSSTSNPGDRKLTVEKIKFLSENAALVDARYIITNPDQTMRKMWSSFVVVRNKKNWQISAIRNMLPTSGN